MQTQKVVVEMWTHGEPPQKIQLKAEIDTMSTDQRKNTEMLQHSGK